MIKRKFTILFAISAISALMSVGYLFVGKNWLGFDQVFSSSVSLTHQLDWDQGIYTNTQSDSNYGQLSLSADGNWVQENLTKPSYAMNYGATFTSYGDYIYVFFGQGENKFYRYHVPSDTWEQRADAPLSTYYGAELLTLNGSIYAFIGNYQKHFYKYSIETDTWTQLADTVEPVWQGSSLVTDGTDIYASFGNSTRELFRYDVSENSWELQRRFSQTVRYGDMAYKNGFIYYMNGSSPNYWYKYEIATDTETRLTNLPERIYYANDIDVVGDYIYVTEATSIDNRFWRFDTVNEVWETLTDTPSPNYMRDGSGVVYHQADGYLYVFRATGSYDFWKYDTVNDSFLSVTDAPAAFSYGADFVRHGSSIYALRGGNTTTLYEFNPSTEVWTTKAASPATIRYRNHGTSDGTYLYFFRGYSSDTFYRYSPGANTWAEMTVSPGTIGQGAILMYPGSGDYIYALRGTGTQSFYRYSISGNSWDDGAVADLPTNVFVENGAAGDSDGTDFYVMPGFGTSQFYKYTTATDTWSALADLPFAPYEGSDLVYDGSGKMYAIEGNYNTGFWEYTIATDTWRMLPSTNAHFGYERGPGYGSTIEFDQSGNLYLAQGGYTWVNKYVPSSYNYVTSGTWISETQDLSYVNSWTSLNLTSTTPGDSSLTVQTRTSADLISWSDWENLSGTSIVSPANRYIQIKVIFNSSTDRSQSPVVEDITLNYVSDNIAPSNPSSITANSQAVGGNELTSGETYSYAHPYFSWSGASDSQTDVAGYYVYFGTNDDADPETAGNWQTNTTYTITEPMIAGSYYLIIKTKDEQGNISDSWSAFTYVFSGVPSEQTLLVDESSEFSGQASDVQLTNDQIKLASADGGVWLEDRLSYSPTGLSYGAHEQAYVSSTNKLYIFEGHNNTPFYEYDIDTDTWTTLSSAPAAVYTGGGAVEGPEGFIYGWAGNNSNSFWRYEIATDTWSDEDASDAPNTMYYGTSAVFDGTYIYFTRGNNDDAFWRYDPANDIWTTLLPIDFGQPTEAQTNAVYMGGDLAYDGNDTIYATQGNIRDGFSYYSISTGEWTTLEDSPIISYQGSAIDYDSTTNSVYYTAGYNREDFYKYSVTDQQWTKLSDAPRGIYYGADLHVIDGYIYLNRGSRGREMYKYKISNDSWLIPNIGIFGAEFLGSSYDTVSAGGSVTKGPGNDVYLNRGGFGDEFIKYNSETGVVTKLADLPSGANYGASTVYDGVHNKVYYTPGRYEQSFYSYDIATDTWEEKDAPPEAMRNGSDMVFDDSQYVYITRAEGSRNFYRFDTTADPGSQWATMAITPNSLHYGSSLLWKNGLVYLQRGYNQNPNPIWTYDPNTNTWDSGSLASLGIDVYYGGFTADGGDGNFYAAKGENTSNFYKYSLSGNEWSQIDDAPANFTYGADGDSDGTKTYVLAGNGTNTYQNALFTYVQQTDSTAFVDQGTYTSETHDLGNVYEFSNLRLTYTPASGTQLEVETRTSSDASTWSSWTAVSQGKSVGTTYEYKINSPANRYIQVKFTLTSDNQIYSGVIDDYSINYVQDLVKPTNPTALTAYSTATMSGQIVTDSWYPYSQPHFDWPDAESLGGSTDTATGSGVVGYYVYFGTNGSADPETDGELITDSSYTASSLTSGETYHLLIKAKDNASNISSDTWAPFIYKYDGVNPSMPTDLSADPSGYSANNSFSFSWEASSDSHSGNIVYCYKTGATSGDYSTDQCTSDLTVIDIPSHKSGTNTFYVRAKDDAGNYSEYATVSYYYSSGAPAPPTNLQVSPSSSTTNSFAFSWNAPSFYFGAEANLTYYYSINALPTANSVSSTKRTSLLAGPYATLPGENVLYVVAQDEAGNIDYGQYASVIFTANTTAPGAPINIDIADVSVKSTSSWKLAVSWESPSSSGSGVSTYKVYRSLDGASYDFHASTGGISYVDTGLDQIVHYYKVQACDSANNCGVFSDVVSLYPDGKFTVPAPLSGDPVVSGITTKKGKISWSTARTADSKVAYGLSSGDYFDEEIGSSDQVTDHAVTLTNLSAGTTYYFVAKWTDEDGNLGVSEESSFSTDPAPSIKEAVAKNTSIDNTLIEFTSAGAAKVKIYYGETTAFGGLKEVYTASTESTYTVSLEGLSDGTKYYYKINTYDSDGAEYEGDINSFETLPRPKITGVRVQQVKGTAQPTVLVTWQTNTEISSIVTYYPSGDIASAKDEVNVALQQDEHRMIIRGLLPATDYIFEIKGRDKVGNEAESVSKTVKTAVDTRPPQIINMKIESSNIKNANGDDFVSQLVVSWTTDEPATSQVEFGEGTGTTYSQKTQEDTNLKLNHLVVIPNLTPSKVYHIRAASRDERGNVGNSIDTVSITPKATDNALNLVVSNLKLVFGFLDNIEQ